MTKRTAKMEDIVRRQRAEACVLELRELLNETEVESAIALLKTSPEEKGILELEEPAFPEFVGSLLRQRRLAADLDQVKLSFAAKLHWRTISQWELTPGRNPKINELARVAEVLDCTVDDFLATPGCAIGEDPVEEDPVDEPAEAREAS